MSAGEKIIFDKITCKITVSKHAFNSSRNTIDILLNGTLNKKFAKIIFRNLSGKSTSTTQHFDMKVKIGEVRHRNQRKKHKGNNSLTFSGYFTSKTIPNKAHFINVFELKWRIMIEKLYDFATCTYTHTPEEDNIINNVQQIINNAMALAIRNGRQPITFDYDNYVYEINFTKPTNVSGNDRTSEPYNDNIKCAQCEKISDSNNPFKV